jgi:tripartite-type tricarboxylate transporter receptor subunit TctC
VPYKGSAFALPDIISGRIQVLFANLSPLLPHIRAATLRPLAVTASRRTRTLPAIPTIAESGYAGYEAVNWFGMVAPARTPDEVVRKLNAAIRQAVNLPEVRGYYENRGAEPITTTPEEMRVFLRSEIDKWAVVARTSGARLD